MSLDFVGYPQKSEIAPVENSGIASHWLASYNETAVPWVDNGKMRSS